MKAQRHLNCPACVHTVKPGYANKESGGLRSAPVSYDLIQNELPPAARLPDRPYQYVPVYAWVDPQPGRHLLHAVIVSSRRGVHFLSFWLDDLRRILQECDGQDRPMVFRLTPNVRALEVLGEKGIRDGLLPKHWLAALRRGYAKPRQDFHVESEGLPNQK